MRLILTQFAVSMTIVIVRSENHVNTVEKEEHPLIKMIQEHRIDNIMAWLPILKKSYPGSCFLAN